MIAGTIIHWPNFVFDDGASADKYFVLLNSPQEVTDGTYIFCKTTSQKKNKPPSEGCLPSLSLFMIKGSKDYFPKDTWLQFYEFFSYSLSEIFENKLKRSVKVVGNLSNLTMRQIRNCLKQCQDVSPEDLKMILDEK